MIVKSPENPTKVTLKFHQFVLPFLANALRPEVGPLPAIEIAIRFLFSKKCQGDDFKSRLE